jgi:hypothetical protein
MSVADNIAFREFDRAPFASGGWWLNRAAFRATPSADRAIQDQDPHAGYADLGAVGRQRAARGAGARARRRGRGADRRQSLLRPRLRRGREIHAEIMAARNRGAAVLLVSEDLDELLELSDRMVVMFHGQFV